MTKVTKLIMIVILCIMQLLFVRDIAKAETRIRVYIDGIQLNFETDPVLINNSVMVPARKIFENLGMKVTYDTSTRTVFAYGDKTAMIIKIDSNKAVVMDKEVVMPVAATEKNGYTLVPLRFIAEVTGAGVTWDNASQKVLISTNSSQNNTIEGNPIDKIDLSNIKFGS